MNLYLVLTIALGAISGVVEAPVARPAAATLASKREIRSERRIVHGIISVLGPRSSVLGFIQPGTEDRGPRTTNARPRAPAIG